MPNRLWTSSSSNWSAREHADRLAAPALGDQPLPDRAQHLALVEALGRGFV
ncbi:hypothetical protein [Rhodovibrio sodomensis]|uniref:hypothetical protein n=1 Tax=Rhodovibrio sodomensis TaxID=1088 RepID=UPI001904D8A4|nr:hypothetical protein [Rhodovibrio sodomensis]